jgi:hypothetical protein
MRPISLAKAAIGVARGGHALSWLDYFDRRCCGWLPAIGQLPSYGLPTHAMLASKGTYIAFRRNEGLPSILDAAVGSLTTFWRVFLCKDICLNQFLMVGSARRYRHLPGLHS